MKNIIAILLLLVGFVSCKTADPCLKCTQTSVTNTVTKEVLVPVEVPADSVLMQALIRCDSAGNIVLGELNELKSSGANTTVKTFGNRLVYKVLIKRDTVYVPVTSTITDKTITITKPPIVLKEPTAWWVKVLAWLGVASILFVTTVTTIFIHKKWKRK